MTSDFGAIEFAAYLAPGTAPLSAREIDAIKQQAADLLDCQQAAIQPTFVELVDSEALEDEFSWIPEHERSREPLLSLVSLLRSGARPLGNWCCMLIYDMSTSLPVIDYLKSLAEITRLPVLLGVCHQPAADNQDRQILVRRLR